MVNLDLHEGLRYCVFSENAIQDPSVCPPFTSSHIHIFLSVLHYYQNQ